MFSAKMAARAVVVLLLLLCIGFFAFRIRREMVDFQVNDKAGARLMWGESLYRAEDGHYQFKYPPFAAMIYVPLAALPLQAAKAVWFAIILAASAGALYLSFRLSRDRRKTASWLAWVPLLVLGRYFLRELQLGQINALITFLLLVMTSLLVTAEEKVAPWGEREAGLLWGFSTALKPYALIFLPYFLLKRKWRTLAWGLAALAAAFILPAAFYGFRGNLAVNAEWVRSLSESTPHLLASQDNVSLMALIIKWTGRPELGWPLWAGGLAVLALLMVFLVRRGRRLENPVALECGTLLLLIPLISPLGWDYTFLSAVLAVAIISRYFADYAIGGRIVLGAVFLLIPLSLYDLMGRPLYARFMSLSVITVCFITLLFYALFLRTRSLR